MHLARAVAGIFVGGQARRMGGRPKGNLQADAGTTILAKLRAACDAAGARVVLVGSPASREPYAAEGLDGLDDDPRAEGPLAGLLALLEHAGGGRAVALACDMPFVTHAVLERLMADPSEAPVLAAKRGDTWEPFFARYDAARVLPFAAAAARSRLTACSRCSRRPARSRSRCPGERSARSPTGTNRAIYRGHHEASYTWELAAPPAVAA